MLAETVLEQKHCARRFSIPYKDAIINPDVKFVDSLLVVEIITYWDVKRSEDERDQSTAKSSTPETRH